MAENSSRPQKSWALTGKGGREKSWSNELESFDFKSHPDRYIKVRLLTQSLTEKLHWVYLDVKNAKKHASGEKLNYKNAPSFPVVCPDFDPFKETSTPNKCPICLHFSSYSKPSLSYYCWAFVGIPSKKKGGEDRWLEDPVMLKLGTSIVIGIQNIISLRGGTDPADPIEGYYVNVMAKSAPSGPNDAYVVQAGEAMKLTKSQRLAVKELPDLFELYKPTAPDSIKASLTQKGYYNLLEEEDGYSEEEEDDEDGESVGKKKNKSGKGDKKKKSKYVEEDDEDADSEDDESEDEDSDDGDEDEVKPSKKNSKKKSSRYDDEDSDSEDEDDQDDDEDDQDDEEEVRPSKKNNKKSSKPEKKSSKKSKYADDEGEDAESEEDDDNDIPAPKNSSIAKKKKLKDAGKKKSRRDLDDDE